MQKIAVIVTGYNRMPAKESAAKMKCFVEQNGYKVFVIDPFEKERKSLIFRKTLLSFHNHYNFIKNINEALERNGLTHKPIDLMICYSYGSVAMFQSVCNVENYVFLSPALGRGTIKWRTKEKIFFFLPGIAEMNDWGYHATIVERVKNLAEISKVYFYLPTHDGCYCEDDRVEYPDPIVGFLESVTAGTFKIPVKTHHDMIDDFNVGEMIIEKINF